MIKRHLVEFRCVADKARASDLIHDVVERVRVGGFLCNRAARDAIDIILPVECELRLIGGPELMADLLPIRVGMDENVLGLGRDLEKSSDGSGVALRKAFVENISDHGDRSFGAEAPFHFIHADEPTECARFESHAESPIVQRGVGLAALGLLIEQSGRAIDDACLRPDVEIRLSRERLVQDAPQGAGARQSSGGKR